MEEFQTKGSVQEEHNYARPVTYFGEDAAQVFVERLFNESKKISYLYSKEAAKPMELSEEDDITLLTATQCHICGKEFTEDKPFVRDHDHLTGKLRGPAHNAYSVKFMSSSLDILVKNLSPQHFKHTSKYYSSEQLKLLQKKGVYPYDFMDSLQKFEYTSLPHKKDFYNKLTMTNIEDEDYEHASKVWNEFNIQSMKAYTLLYNQSDVLQLADVMENFRNICMETYQLDPAWYYTAPGLAWSAMLKTTEIELELLSDYNMILMIGNGIRGGLSQCSNRYATANNKYMEESYNENLPTSYLTYLDANNLYGWAMSQHMPYSDFKWVEDVHNLDILSVPDDGNMGYILEVDLEYPQELHDLHSDLPLAPERQIPPGSKQEKLLATLFDKKRYVLHFRNLKQYISLGLKLKNIHKAISFTQSNWLKPYIDLNTSMRTKATNNFEKDFFKLMNNAVFGKTMENIRNRVNIRLATKEKQVDKWLAQPNFKRRTIFTDQLAAVHMSKTKLVFNKPIYVGMSILDVSKTLMYDFHYNVIKARYGDKVQLQYTDTDSLTYLTYTDDVYKDMKEMQDFFDTSDYPPNHPCFSVTNKKIIGKFKDELNGRIMFEHIALRSKMYAKHYVDNGISFQDYTD
ncbi:uncharacterized protein LOC128989333 [Macrosteles quadrilineatus]|uniref:uncharacterized protein LOC128989333 n=1 Tax=Macrosteles quadrilineatus TaxID=74068 RepID=UPI0023E2D1B2|nr:uncharacterized protein LOC128989333 [Macrosteles quadrilineatus]